MFDSCGVILIAGALSASLLLASVLGGGRFPHDPRPVDVLPWRAWAMLWDRSNWWKRRLWGGSVVGRWLAVVLAVVAVVTCP